MTCHSLFESSNIVLDIFYRLQYMTLAAIVADVDPAAESPELSVKMKCMLVH
jgi:hypothetical protein